MPICLICQTEEIETLLDFGKQPISNRYLKQPTCSESQYALLFGVCKHCGLFQLLDPVPPLMLKPQFDWIHYHEPEGHLDELVGILTGLPGISLASNFLGISSVEKTTLDRLRVKGFQTSQLDKQDDLNILDACAGTETIQQLLTLEKASEIREERGCIDVVIARRLLEHAQNPLVLAAALCKLVREDGYIVFEVPDCTKLFVNNEYSALWEERVSYFTPFTFLETLRKMGFLVSYFYTRPYMLEDVMIAVVRLKTNMPAITPIGVTSHVMMELDRVHQYADDFMGCCDAIKAFLLQCRQSGKIAVFGAGHLACHFINLMGVAQYINFVVDDNPHKKGLFMPGSHLPILPSSALIEEEVKTCLLTLNQESEGKVIETQKDFVAQGGRFFSIFSTSQYTLRRIRNN